MASDGEVPGAVSRTISTLNDRSWLASDGQMIIDI